MQPRLIYIVCQGSQLNMNSMIFFFNKIEFRLARIQYFENIFESIVVLIYTIATIDMFSRMQFPNILIEKSGISFIAFYIDFRRFYSSLLCNGIRMLFPCINPEVTLEYFFTDTHTIIVLDNHVYSCMSAQNVLHPEYYNIYFPVDLCNNQFFARCPVWVYIRAVQIHFLAFSSFD